jgi:hypothetical protein
MNSLEWMSQPSFIFLGVLVLKLTLIVVAALFVPSAAFAQSHTYKVLATSKTSTMQKEMQEAGDGGFRFVAVMGGETAVGGKEVVILMEKTESVKDTFSYQLLATSKTSTLQKELQEAADAGFAVVGQTVFESMFGGKETAAIVEKASSVGAERFEYKLLATSKTSTLEKELKEAAAAGYQATGLTVGKTAMGGTELVVITRKKK